MPRTRRTYTAEFKTEAVKLVTEQGYSVAEAARSLGVSENLIRNWKQARHDQGEQAFPGQGPLSPFEAEVQRRRADNKRLVAERDLLKKAAAFFAREATGPSASSTSTRTSGPFVYSAKRSKVLPLATTPGGNGLPANSSSDAMPSSSRSGPSTPSSRHATAAHASPRNSSRAGRTAVSTRSLN